MKKYEVGYMKPPKENQFKPGQSGNVKGRTRGSKNTYRLLDDLLSEKAQVVRDGKTVKISKKALILLQTVNKAIKGDIKAIQTLLTHMLVIDEKNADREAVKNHIMAPDDKEILSAYFNKEKNEGEDNE